LKAVGYPPIQIKGQKITEIKSYNGCWCQQSIHSTLLLVASNLENGIELS
jgi:3-phosphoshikimate 1-carboxyvinyltransferase